MATTNSGGKNRAPARTIPLLKAVQTLIEEALPPLADDLPAGVEAVGDLVVPQPLRCEKDYVGSKDISIR
jgi:hypothetical protein